MESTTLIPRSVGTHDGTFHADEVTACALLVLFGLIDEDKIFRSRDPEFLKRCEYVCDVGGIYDPESHRFDHHQVDYRGELSSAGMILLFLKEKNILDASAYRFFQHSLILGVDAHDNGKEWTPPGVANYSHIISNFAPIIYDASKKQQDEAFFEAFHFALSHLRRLWERFLYTRSCKEVVKEAMSRYKECLFFEKAIPWIDSFFELEGVNHPAVFVIMPVGGHWKLRGIPPNLQEKMEVRCPLPAAWAGLLEEELKKVSGIPGAVFCHKGRFISVWQTKDDALKALEIALQNRKKR